MSHEPHWGRRPPHLDAESENGEPDSRTRRRAESPHAPAEKLETVLGSARVSSYVERKISDALSPYEDGLRPQEIAWMRSRLHAELTDDPMLRGLVARLGPVLERMWLARRRR